MGLYFRKSFGIGRLFRVNLSKRGASYSVHAGPVSASSRGRRSVRLLPGLSYRWRAGKRRR